MEMDFTEHLERSLISLISILLSCCSSPTSQKKAYDIAELQIRNENGIILTGGKAFTGRLYALNNADTVFIREYKDGLEHGLHKSWYPNQQVAEIRHYQEGKKTGSHSGFWVNGQRKYLYKFVNDLYEDTQYEWYANGRPFSKRTYADGHERGLQQVWSTDGKIISNYEAKNGRNYGNIGKKSCLSKT